MPTIVQISPGDDVVEASSEDMAPVEEDTVDAVEASSKDVIPVEDDTAAVDVIETTTAEAIQIDLKDAPEEELIEETTVAIDTKLVNDVTTAAPGAEVTTILAIADILPDPITAVIPAVELGDASITDSVLKISEETETALDEIKNQTSVSLPVYYLNNLYK